MCTRYGSNGYSPAPKPPSLQHLEVGDEFGYHPNEFRGGVHTSQHLRTGSDETIMQGRIQRAPSHPLHHILKYPLSISDCLLIVTNIFVYLRGIILTYTWPHRCQSVQAFTSRLPTRSRWWEIHTPLSLTLTTSGCPSSSLKLTPCFQELSLPLHGLVVLHQIIHIGERSYVLRGYLAASRIPVVGKLSRSRQSSGSHLTVELATYQKLYDLQGTAIPRCFGLFEVEDFAFLLLLEDCGSSISSFNELTAYQRYVSSTI
jgi:hypothetical protein